MKILHICLASSFTVGLTYQENILADINREDGNDVLIVADCSKYKSGKLVNTQEETTILGNGVKLIRLKYDFIITRFISSKIRKSKQLINVIDEFAPDVILHHGLASYELITVAKYKAKHPNVRYYADSHLNYENSARNILSKYILHRIIYKYFIYKALPFIDKIFYVGYDDLIFIKQIYHINDMFLEYLPLGGIIINRVERANNNIIIRDKYGIPKRDYILIHSGKMDNAKRSLEIVNAVHNIQDARIHLFLIGMMPPDIQNDIMPIIESDKRISFLGWKSAPDLLKYLCACDLYIQLGSVSATLQNAICCWSAVATYPHIAYKHLFGDDVFYIQTADDIEKLLHKILRDKNILYEKRMKSFKLAQEILDYKKIAARLYR